MARHIFPTKKIRLADTTETVVAGGRDKFFLVEEALRSAGIKQICVLGWSSQGPAQAQNLRDSIAGSNIKVVIGLRKGSPSFAKAAEVGFNIENGTAGEMFDVISTSDLVIALISDAAMVANYEQIQSAMKPGATLGLSHGFLLGHIKNVGTKFRSDINVVGVCPKGMGPSVRRLYVQGKNVNGAGINSSYAVEQDATGNARNIALAWAIGIGSPYVFETTLEMEYRSDIFGERAILLGAVWGVAESMYAHFVGDLGTEKGEAFVRSAMSITGPISQVISQDGLIEVGRRLSNDPEKEQEFYRALHATYRAALPLVDEIYNEVKSGREIASVVDQTAALDTYGWTKVDGSTMWRTGETARKGNIEVPLEPTTAGVYLGIMMAQVEALRRNGHGWSEICNESIIEATDSLNPYIAARGIDYMIDNCSTTARLGGRKWGPRFMQMVTGDVLPKADVPAPEDFKKWFLEHPVHGALAECMKFRPPVSISVQ
jgi:ketol-acid reductoisomerase